MNNSIESGETFHPEEVSKTISNEYKLCNEVFNSAEIQNKYLKHTYEHDFEIGNETGEEPFYLAKPNKEEDFFLRSRGDGFNGDTIETIIEKVIEDDEIEREEDKEQAIILLKDILNKTKSFRIKESGVFRNYKNEKSGEIEEQEVDKYTKSVVSEMLDKIRESLGNEGNLNTPREISDDSSGTNGELAM